MPGDSGESLSGTFASELRLVWFDPHTTVHHGTAHVLDDANALTDVKDAVLRKYGWQARLVRLTDTIKERLGRGENPIAVRIDIKPTSPTPA